MNFYLNGIVLIAIESFLFALICSLVNVTLYEILHFFLFLESMKFYEQTWCVG